MIIIIVVVVMVMMLIGTLLFFFFVLLVHVHIHKPFGYIGIIGCIDDDMRNKHVHFFVFPSFFPVLLVPTLSTRYLLRGIPPR